MLHFGPIIQCDFQLVIGVYIVDHMTDAFLYYRIVAVEMDNYIVIKGEQVEMTVQSADDFHAVLYTGVPVIDVFLQICNEQLEQRVLQMRQPRTRIVRWIGAEAALRKIREKLCKKEMVDCKMKLNN